MGKMTSTPYGLKVKEHTNHADYKDVFDKTVFKIYYNESTHVWSIISNYDRLWSDGVQYYTGDTILSFTNTSNQEKTVLGQYDQEGTEVYRNIMYRIKCYQGEAGGGRTKQMIQITGGYSPKTYDKDTVCTDILHTHVNVYYNGKWHKAMYLLYDNPSIAGCWMKKVGSLAITYAYPYWYLMTTQSGIVYNGHAYESRKLISSWSQDDYVNMTLYYHKSRKRELKNPDTDKFDKLVYDVQCFAPDGKVILTYEVNQESQDSIEFYPSDSPVLFHNIEFKASSNKWTIYSKCGYIKYSGRTYKTNQAIFSVGFDENLHVEIKDESNVYEIESTTTYTVKSVQVGNVSYKLWTVTIDKSLKIEKTVNTTVEPWISLRYYEAMYEPVVIDDLILEFSNVDMKWYLKSNNDNLYCAGTNYQKGKLITYWDYDYIQNLKYITVLSSSSEYGIELKKLTSGDVPYISEDIDEIYDESLKICYSASKGLWEIISVNDETYYNGLQFLEGQIIVSFKDRTILDQFTILVKKEVEGEDAFDNILYTCYTGVDLINGITTLTVNGMSWANKTATDANKSTIVTKDSAKSMYGYIWQKSTPPGPTPTPDMYRYYLIPVLLSSNYDYGVYGNGYRYIALIRVEYGHRYVKKVAYNEYYNRINFIDEFEVFNNDLMLTLYGISGKGMYRYWKWYQEGPEIDNNWSYVGPFPNNSGYTIYYHDNNTKIVFTLERYYIDSGAGWRIIKRVYNDEYLWDYTEYTKEIFYSDSLDCPELDHECNGYFNGEKHSYGAGSGIMSYIDKDEYLLLFSNGCLVDSTSANRLYISAKLNISNLELTSFKTQVPIDLQVLKADAISRGLPDNYLTQATLSAAQMTVGKYQLYYVMVQNNGYWQQDPRDQFYMVYAYKYDIEENTIVLKGSYKLYPIIDTGGGIIIDPDRMYDTPWKIPDVISNGKGYCYYKTPDNTKLEIYEIEDPYDFEDIYSGGEKVAEYLLSTSISLYNLGENSSSQFTYDILFKDYRTYGNSSGVSKREYYDNSINRFLNNNDKKGMFRYVFNTENGVEPMVVYFPDPTLEDISSAFFFKVSALRYRSEINEEWFNQS